jgi:hypothetical protein
MFFPASSNRAAPVALGLWRPGPFYLRASKWSENHLFESLSTASTAPAMALNAFWHWEILRPGSSKPIKGGVVYGTKQAAKDKIAVEMLQLSKAITFPSKNKRGAQSERL